MKILMVTPSYHPIIGGSETLTQTLSIKLNDIGIHTDIMTLNMKEKWNPVWREEIEKNGMFKVFKVPAFNPFSSIKINPLHPLLGMNVIPKPSFIRKFKDYDIIHFISEADMSFPLFSYHIKRPKIMHCVGIFKGGGTCEHYKRHVLLNSLSKRFFTSFADLYIVYPGVEVKLLSDLGVPAFKILTLPLCVDVKTFRPAKTKKIDDLILFVGRIDIIKGLHILIKALSYLKSPTELAIIGPKWDPKYVEETEEMYCAVNEKGVHRVKYLGAMDETSLVPWYQKAAVLVCPYLVEASSLASLEALACGTPVIGTGNHLIKDGVNGILVPPKDPRKLADALKKLLEDKELREKYGREGRRIVEQSFSWETIIRKLVKVYESLLCS